MQAQNTVDTGGEGVNASRSNAMQHGLTSKKLLPKALQGKRVEYYRERLRRELEPATTVEEVLVDEMARHAAMMEFSEQTEGAVLRHGASELASLLTVNTSDSHGDDDAVLSAAVATETLERFCRYRRMHERGFFAALQRLQDSKELRSPNDRSTSFEVEFATESQCADWLKRRFEQPGWSCSRCGSSRGCWLESRQRWQCAGCKHQHGVRSGTVMERSPLPLVKWFLAINTVLARPELRALELADRIGLNRQKTASSMITKICAAREHSKSSALLAGLDTHRLVNRKLT
ncbi:MAG: transposase [Planctomycetaceae bacterium]|nr:transposase [Planctomycetales bacterium]MCB9920887.1 transposase [Planctomycetaceae bacterium]